jgi:2-polyprenyl-3-methyl-5-hydroxy-6-metoxy-1,4-benzoquinol methylase
MAIGSEQISYGRTPIRRAMGTFFGISDLHTHIRVRPLLRHLPPLLPVGPAALLECGCGMGINIFELAKVKNNIVAEGYDLDEAAIAHANSVKSEFFPDRAIALHRANVTELGTTRDHYDCVLLMDILEHINDDSKLAAWVTGATKKGGLICVSVPSPRYRQVFGEEFHSEVGHVREGYNAAQLTALFPGLELVGLWYNTGLVSQFGCWIYYRYLRKFRLPIVGGLMLLACQVLFAWTDFPNDPKYSCSIFAIFRKSFATNSSDAS